MKVCKEEDCNRKYYAKGHCYKHYVQMRQHGKTLQRTRSDPNEIVIKGDIAEIVLYNRKCQEVARAVINAEDVEKVKKYKWHLGSYGYVVTNGNNGRNRVGIQNIIMGFGTSKKYHIDHKNRNPLINRKFNLRLCTHKENVRNRGKQKNNTSGYKGVSWAEARKGWVAQIRVNRKTIHLGAFKDKINAALAYNKAALKHHGGFACLNNL